MTTAKGFMRSYGAAMHRIEKANQRKLKDQERQEKQQNKLSEILHANHTAHEHEAHVSKIVSLHKIVSESMNWDEITRQPADHS